MVKPTWKPNLSKELRRKGYSLCLNCGWRKAKGQLCPTCAALAQAHPFPATDPPRVRAMHGRRGPSNEREKAAIREALSFVCTRCSAKDHTSLNCPVDTNMPVG